VALSAGRGAGAALLGLLALVLGLFHEAVFGGRVFYERDIQLAWQPQASVFARCLAQGSWPLWDPFQAFGQPLLADPSAQVLYPPTWLNVFLLPWTYYTVFVVGHSLLGAAGVYALARRLGTSGGGAFVAAVLWMLSGPTLSMVNLYHHFSGAAWIPWVVWAADRALRSGRARDIGVAGLILGLQLLAGSAEMVVAAVLLAALDAALSIVDWRAPLGPANRRLARSAVLLGLIAAGLAAAQWLPTAEAAWRSQRRQLEPAQRTVWSVHPLVALETLLPVSTGLLPLRNEWRLAWFDGREPFLLSLHLGMPAVGLVAVACARRRRLPALAAGGALLYALGRYTPVHALACALIPPLASFRYPSKAMAGVALGWALLAGMGFDAWKKEDAPGGAGRFRWTAAALGVLALVGLAVLGALWLAPDRVAARLLHQPDPYGRELRDILRPARWDLAFGVITTLVVAGLAAARSVRPSFVWAAPVVALLAAAELAWVHRSQNPTAPRELLAHRPEALAEIRQNDARRLYVYDYAGFGGKAEQHLRRSAPYWLARIPPGWTRDLAQALALRLYPVPPQPAIWGLAGSFDLDARRLFPPYLADLVGFVRVTEGTAEHVRLLRIGAVSDVLALHQGGFEDLTPAGTYESLFHEPVRRFSVPGALPRAYAVGGSRTADGRFALERVLVDPGFDPEREVVLTEGSAQAGPAAFKADVRITDLRPDRVHLDAMLSHDGWVVLVDSFDPGWTARLDGRDVPLLRANHAFRAVRVPAGRHRIEQVYRPASVRWGLAISGLALVVGIALACAGDRRPPATV
jgi:hypothetical protein